MKKNRFIVFLLCFVMMFASAGCQVADFFAAQTPIKTPIETVVSDDETDKTDDSDFADVSGDKADTTGNNDTETSAVCKVSVVYNNGASDGEISVKKGQTFPAPQDPAKTHYLFTGWYNSASLTEKYDFSEPVKENLTIYAGYSLDAVSLTNTITTETIKGVVKVYNKCYNSFMGHETSSSTSQGSGFCFRIEDGKYYILTNCHVAKEIAGYSYQKYTIEDYQGNEFTGYLYKNPDKTVDAIAAEYDLACLYFTSSSTNVTTLPLAEANPLINDDVILLGAPKNQSNAITYGVVSAYTTIKVDATPDESNVTFDVIESSAYSNNGSSGGATLNANLQIVGVSYAVNDGRTKSYAIPIIKVREFLAQYVDN